MFTLFYKGSACKSSANLDDIAVSKTPVYFFHAKVRKNLNRERKAQVGTNMLARIVLVLAQSFVLGNVVRGWPTDAAKEALVKSLVLEVIGLFGAKRCMFNSNCAPHPPFRHTHTMAREAGLPHAAGPGQS